MAFAGVTAQQDGPGRWRLVEPGRGSEGTLAVLTGDEGSGYRMEAAADAGSSPPAGVYGTVEDAVQAVEIWRQARFEGRRD